MIRTAFPNLDPSALLAVDVSTTVGIVAIAGSLGLGLLIGILLRWSARRRGVDEVRELVRSLEELRSGSLSRRPAIDRNSSLALVSDAVGRLSEDVSARWKDVDGTSDRLQAVLGAVPDLAILTIDDDGDVTSLGSGGASLLGYEEPQLVGHPVSKLFDEEAWREFLPKLSRKVLRVRGTETRARLRRADGSSIVVRIALRGLLDTRGRLHGFLLVLREDTTREEMEVALRDSEARYRQLLEGLREGVMILEDGLVVYANPAASEQLDVPLDSLVGKPWRDRVASEDVLLIRQALEDTPESYGLTRSLVLRLREFAPMRRICLEAAAVPYNGHACWLCTFQLEKSPPSVSSSFATESHPWYQALWNAEEGAIRLDGHSGELRVQEYGGAVAEWFGGPLEEGVLWAEYLACHSDSEGCRRLAQWWEASPRSAACIEFSQDGKRVALEVSWIPVGEQGGGWIRVRDVAEERTRNGEYESLLAVSETTAREREEKLEASHLRLQKLEAWAEELQRLEEMKTGLLRNVTHELQTPLVSIRGFTEMILRERLGPLNEEQKKGMNISLKGIDRLISMIDGLSTFTHEGESSGVPKLSVFPIGEVIDEVASLQHLEREQAGLILRTEISDPAALVEADRGQVVQVFTNLLGNAMKYNRKGGSILVRTRPPGDYGLPVEIHDTGVGIPADRIDSVFEPGARAREEDRSRGSGLGLSIVRDLLRMHGCEIRLQSEVGKGSCFSFHLPVPADPLAKPEPPSVEETDPGKPAQPNGEEDPWVEASPLPIRRRAPDRLSQDTPRFRVLRRG